MGEMHVCERCGKPTPNYRLYMGGPIGDKAGYSKCDECSREALIEMEWENEQYHEDEITCPWCGYKDLDGYVEDIDESYQCPYCGEFFEVEVVTVYTSRRNAKDMPEGWSGEDD